ncbi:MAG: hypothetical protein ACQES1_01070 [Bacteroidota bacterium]
MIQKLTTILLTILMVGNLMAQKIEVKEDKRRINKSRREVLLVKIPGTEEKTVEKAWKDLMKDYDADKVKRRKEVFADNVLIPTVTNNTVDVYARAKENDGFIEFYVAVDLGGAYMGSDHPDEKSAMKTVIRDFAVQIAAEAYGEIIEDREDLVEDIEDEIKDLNKDKEHLEKKNEKYREKIEDNVKEIEDIEKELEEQTETLEEAQKKLKEINKKHSKID